MVRTEPHPVDDRPRHARPAFRKMLLGGILLLLACAAVRYWWPVESASAQAGRGTPRPAPTQSEAIPPGTKPSGNDKLQVVAVVNREEISRNELAQQALWHFGKDVLESLINKHVVAQQCQARGIEVTPKEVQEEIDRLAKRFGLPTEQYLKMLHEGREISPAQYAEDMVWPTLALRKLAAERLQVTQQEIDDAYESEYGPSVQVRLIACRSEEKAYRVHAEALTNPDDFPNLAKDHSDDRNSASARGLIQPIRRHVGDKTIEQIAFSLKPGEISDVIPVAGQYVILRCEKHLPARPVPRENVVEILEEGIRDKKLQAAAGELYRELQDAARVENIFNDPEKRKQMPGVAAVINGHQITLRELAEKCIERHGKDVLDGTISRRLLEQALRQKKLTVTDEEIDEEIRRAALLMGKVTDDGRPDVDAWLNEVVEEQGIPIDLYVHDAVWPSVALKKLVGGNVEVTQDDLRKGFEANYGPRVRCRAIVFNDLRRAQEVWEMARKNPSVEFFGELAEQYSIEASSRALKGQVPPIQKWGGQPLLEEEAFALKPGELSSVIQVGDKFVVLLCEGRTEPKSITFEEVRDLIYEDIHEKKLRIAMAQHFSHLKETAQIDNYLAGTTQSGKPAQPDDQFKIDPEVRRAAAELPLPTGPDPSKELRDSGPRAGSAAPPPSRR